MPIVFGTIVTSGTYDADALTITAVGQAFADNQYSGKLEYKKTIDASWTEVSGYDSWSDTQVVGTISDKLTGGWYDLRVTSGDGEVGTALSQAFNVPAGGIFFFFNDDAQK